MGYLGDPSQPEVQKAIAGVEKKVFASGKFLGTVGTTWEAACACFRKGYQWMILMQDGAALRKAADDASSKFRNEYGDQSLPADNMFRGTVPCD